MVAVLKSASLEPVEVEAKCPRYPVIWDVYGRTVCVNDLYLPMVTAAVRHGIKPLSKRRIQQYVSEALQAVNSLSDEKLYELSLKYGFDPVLIKRVDQCGKVPYYSRHLFAMALRMQNFEVISPHSCL